MLRGSPARTGEALDAGERGRTKEAAEGAGAWAPDAGTAGSDGPEAPSAR
jgi:hypothetical protein